MNFKLLFLSFLLCATTLLMAQKHTFSGVVTDAETKEPLLGANIWLGTTGTVTDFDGFYSIQLVNGTYEAQISYVGYEKQTTTVTIAGSDVVLNVAMEGSQMLKEVMVTADIARARETPVAFSNITPIQLQEELAAQELPMVLNSTPGAYATQTGGGDGDARITIRGFNQRNVAVMLDGIPVNDMENGWVYWSNWFGLDLVTQRMQVQRGLGASKLSVPSVGGTINILTKGIDNDKSLKISQEVGNNGFLRSTFGLNTGRLKGGWGISAAGSYKTGDGWVDATFTEGYFYYLRIDKKLGNHLISLSGFGAPQEHGQRPFTTEIAFVDADYARELGVPEESISDPNTGLTYYDRGRRYNEHWGYRDGEVFSTRKNYYHKPQFSLRHSWQANEKLFWSNIAYLSIGNGGGTAPGSSSDGSQSLQRFDNGLYDIEGAIEANQLISPFRPEPVSDRILRSSINNHFWYGFLSTLSYNLSPNVSLSGGLDGRYYRGDHYREIYDLLGGDYFIFRPVLSNQPRNQYQIDVNKKLYEGDKIFYDYSSFVRSAGLFGQMEWKKDDWTAFVNVSTAISGYSIEDYMRSKVVELPDTTLFVSYDKPLTHNDVTYTVDSPEAQNQKVDWINLPSFTFKMGASRKLGNHHNVFFNTGYLSKAQRFNNVINTQRYVAFNEYKNERIIGLELGYGYTSPVFSANVNIYNTSWQNKPLESAPTVPIPNADGTIDEDSERVAINVPGIDALHQGFEADFAFKPSKKITFEGLISLGNWRWTSSEVAEIYFDGRLIRSYEFDATGVHVGDAAQTQLGGLLRYEPIKGLYFSLRGTFFDNNYSDFQPEDLKPESNSARRDSWKLPDYMLYNFHAGYNFRINKTKMGLRFNVLNLFDTVYLSDARNNDDFNERPTADFDAKSASVNFGQGRRWTTALSVEF
ncbi:MAG: TonB-dependent receptor [Chitinophagales bacterium]